MGESPGSAIRKSWRAGTLKAAARDWRRAGLPSWYVRESSSAGNTHPLVAICHPTVRPLALTTPSVNCRASPVEQRQQWDPHRPLAKRDTALEIVDGPAGSSREERSRDRSEREIGCRGRQPIFVNSNIPTSYRAGGGARTRDVQLGKETGLRARGGLWNGTRSVDVRNTSLRNGRSVLKNGVGGPTVDPRWTHGGPSRLGMLPRSTPRRTRTRDDRAMDAEPLDHSLLGIYRTTSCPSQTSGQFTCELTSTAMMIAVPTACAVARPVSAGSVATVVRSDDHWMRRLAVSWPTGTANVATPPTATVSAAGTVSPGGFGQGAPIGSIPLQPMQPSATPTTRANFPQRARSQPP